MAKQLVYQFELGGQTRTLNFGWYCWELFGEKMDVNPDEVIACFQGPKTFRAMRIVVYCAIVANDYLNRLPNSVTEQDVAIWLNENGEIMNEIIVAALQNFTGINADEIEVKNPSKKKSSRSKRSKK